MSVEVDEKDEEVMRLYQEFGESLSRLLGSANPEVPIGEGLTLMVQMRRVDQDTLLIRRLCVVGEMGDGLGGLH